jgi:hypothetical protein
MQKIGVFLKNQCNDQLFTKKLLVRGGLGLIFFVHGLGSGFIIWARFLGPEKFSK